MRKFIRRRMTMTGTQAPHTAATPSIVPSAVAWIGELRATVATSSRTGRISTCQFNRGWLREPAYLAHVARLIGDRGRVVILGPSELRVALEREYLSLFKRPDRLVDVEPAALLATDELVERVRTLSA
jgi:hypothetical protein